MIFSQALNVYYYSQSYLYIRLYILGEYYLKYTVRFEKLWC